MSIWQNMAADQWARPRYFTPVDGLPPQQSLLTDRAAITEAYTFIPRGVLRDIVTSRFPLWHGNRAWVLSRPVAGFATTFSQSIVELDPGGGSERPEPGAHVECVLFVMSGELRLTLDDTEHTLSPGGYADVALATRWTVSNAGNTPVFFQLRSARHISPWKVSKRPSAS